MVLVSHHITLLLSGHDGTVCRAKCHTDLNATPYTLSGYLWGLWRHLCSPISRPQHTSHPAWYMIQLVTQQR